MTTLAKIDRVRGCLLGGAVGDALGAPIEFLSTASIRGETLILGGRAPSQPIS